MSDHPIYVYGADAGISALARRAANKGAGKQIRRLTLDSADNRHRQSVRRRVSFAEGENNKLRRSVIDKIVANNSHYDYNLVPSILFEYENMDIELATPYRITGFSNAINHAWLHRLLALGLLPGAEFTVERIAPLGDPVQIRAGSTSLMLRRKDLALFQLSSV